MGLKVKFRYSDLFKQGVANHPDLKEKIQDFLKFKQQDPIAPYGSSDTMFISKGPIGKLGLKLKHAHISQDVSIVYRVHGKDPHIIDLYGVMRHKDLGTSNTANIKKQKSAAKKFKNQDF